MAAISLPTYPSNVIAALMRNAAHPSRRLEGQELPSQGHHPNGRRVRRQPSRQAARKAAEALKARGIPTPEGRKWYATQVIRVRKRLADE